MKTCALDRDSYYLFKMLSVFCGCWLGLCWGCNLGCISFLHIWYYTPCLRAIAINCGCCQKLWGTFLNCCLAPICESCGLIFSRITINKNEDLPI
ncbi:hypothetical protein A3Q56_06930 [Intoshia linei]|uniref:Caveolin n=1 Tax=Intoshia linei TaxID=1819745 RepID=A0A177AU51_9BILA|nr:hypothetical protein A3Q56_06930 [Intoshia linei]